MRKEFIICLITVILIVVVNVITQNNTKQVIAYMEEKLDVVKQNILNEEEQGLENLVEEIMQGWKERKEILEYYIEHDELEKVETELTSLMANIQVEEYKQGLPDVEKSIFILDHIKEKYLLRIQNIF